MGDLRAGVIGLGVMGKNHARILTSLPGVSLTGIVDPAGLAGEPTAELFRSINDLIMRGVDYCFVAVPTALHVEVGLALAEAGVHALIEKPLATDVSGARALAKAFADNGLIGAVGHIERYNPALQQARVRIEEGQLGQVYQIATRREGPFPVRIADVGAVKDLATHDIDLTTWIAQQPYRFVATRTAYRAGREHEDMIVAVGELKSGIITTHTVNWLSPFKERQTIISGERGAFIVDTLTADLTFHANGRVQSEWADRALFRGVSEGDVIRYAFPRPEPLRSEHEAFRDAVLGLDSAIVTLEEGVRTVEVAEAMILSAQSGQTVLLNEV